ncbi:MAG: thermopsin family protease [Cuniculiplasma sp.]
MKIKKILVLMIALMSVIGFSIAVLGTGTTATPNHGIGVPANTSTSSNHGNVKNSGNTSQFKQYSNNFNSTAKSSVKSANTTSLKNNIGNLQNSTNKKLTNNLFLPNYKAAQDYKMVNKTVHPSYKSAPAPMGLGDFGVKNESGVLKAYNLSSSSFEGSITINNLSALYVLNDNPRNISIQLNTVLNQVTLFGNSTYTFWTQNVIIYSTTHHTLSFEDNLWNFSNNKTILSPNAIYSSSGNVLPYPGVHIALGPTFSVNEPFTVHLYINSTLINNRNAVFFNYSIPTLHKNGTYDRVIFNSTYGTPSGFTTPQANFLVSGSQITPTGYLLYDAEMMIGGPGGGSTTDINNINANMTLKYFNATTSSYMNVPSAFNFGTDTGETSSGESIYWTAKDVAQINTGPSILQGMWGIQSSAKAGDIKVTGSISPSNAFLFLNTGTMVNNITAQWSPLMISGSFKFFLTPGTYSGQVLLDNYAPNYTISITGKSGNDVNIGTISLVFNTSHTGYTPLYALNNAQLANISGSGKGTVQSPYILDGMGQVDPVFGQLNDFGFPVFMGLFLHRTTMNVHTNLTDQAQPTVCLSYNMTPLFQDTMPLVIYKSQNFSVIGMGISGAVLPVEVGFIVGEIMFWDSSNDFVILANINSFTPFVSVNSTDITVSYNQIDAELIARNGITQYGEFAMYCGSVILANNIVTDTNLTEVDGTVNMLGNTFMSDNQMITTGVVNGRGNVINSGSIESISSYVNSVDNNECCGVQILSVYSTMNGTNDSVCCSQEILYQSTVSNQEGIYCCLSIQTIGSDLSFMGSYLNCTTILADKSMVNMNGVNFLCSPINAIQSMVSIIGGSGTGLCVTNVKGTVSITGATIIGSSIISEYGNFTMTGSSFEGFEYESINSNNVFTGNLIETISSSLNLPSGIPSLTFILTLYGKNTFSRDTFAAINSFNMFVRNAPFPNLNSVTLIDGQNSVEKTLFYTNGGNSPSSLVIEYGNNIVQYNTFESKDVSLGLNHIGAGSSLIVYGGNNVIGHNKFISINSPASSSLIKYGDVSTQSTNQYLYSVNFTESGLPANTTWTLDINGTTYTITSSYHNVILPSGTYSYTASSYGYGKITGTVSVANSSTSETLTFTKSPQYSITFQESGLSSKTNWTVTMDSQTKSSDNGTITFTNIPEGTYSYTVSDSSVLFSPSSSTGTVDVTSNMIQGIPFVGVSYAVTFHETGLSSGTNWTVIVNGHNYSSKGKSSINLSMPINSVVSYTIKNETGYISSLRSGSTVLVGNFTLTVNFAKPGVSPTLTWVGIIAGVIGGLAAGSATVFFVVNKKKPQL